MKTKLFLLFALILIGVFRYSAQQELIVNGSFENGEQGWNFSQAPNGYGDIGYCAAVDGLNYLWFGDYNEQTGLNDINYQSVSQTVTLPSNLISAEFFFRWSGTSNEQDALNEYDFLYFGFSDENGDIFFLDSISNANLDPTLTVDDCDDWSGGVYHYINNQYAGQNIEVVFAVYTDDILPTIFRVDDVSILATMSSAGLSEIANSLLEISPNPANEKVIINNDSSSDILVSILNAEGRIIQSLKLVAGENELNISSLSNGLFFIQEPNGFVSKVIKQ